MEKFRRIVPWLSFMPLACVIALWIWCDNVNDDYPIWEHQSAQRGIHHDSVHLSFTPFHAIELATVKDSILINDRRCGYYLIRKHPAILGIYIGTVPEMSASRAFVIMLPIWLFAVLATIWPAYACFQKVSATKRGFPIIAVDDRPSTAG